MSRITDNKTIRPIRQPDDGRAREKTEKREIPVPPGARVASTILTPIQTADNLRLIARYQSLKHERTKEAASKDFQAKFKGWKKRDSEKRKGKPQQEETEDEGKENQDDDDKQGS
jgi:hypothetical protein